MRSLLQRNFRNHHDVGMALALDTHLSAQSYGAFANGARCEGHKGLPLHAIIADLYVETTVVLHERNAGRSGLRMSPDITEPFGHDMEGFGCQAIVDVQFALSPDLHLDAGSCSEFEAKAADGWH